MTNDEFTEAIKDLKWIKENGFVADDKIVGTDRIKKAIDVALEELEKQPKEPIWQDVDAFLRFWACECGCPVDAEMNYCPHCGSKLDWSEQE